MVGSYAFCRQDEITRPVVSAVACHTSPVQFQHQLLDQKVRQWS
jgi:hypothetical protein